MNNYVLMLIALIVTALALNTFLYRNTEQGCQDLRIIQTGANHDRQIP